MKAKKFHLRDVLLFLAGVEFFQTISHVVLTYMVTFPWHTKYLLVTRSLNNGAVLFNAAVTIGLLIWISKLKR